MINRSAGVLLNISSLPGKYGIGDFGYEARSFVDFISGMGFSVWQTLPLCPVGGGNSPYSSISAFALNPLYISADLLVREGYISKEQAENALYHGSPYSADYPYAKRVKTELLAEAYKKVDMEKLAEFIEENIAWLPDYAHFCAGKEANGGAEFWDWINDIDTSRADYYCFEQFIAFSQWAELKKYANEKGVSIFGDMPIYVSRDSADFYAAPEQFQVDDAGRLTSVAGVPPDYFSADGQLWGNPLYDWEHMKKDGYSWWINRIAHNLKFFDYLRIDHFRGFDRYWAVPAAAKTAKEGEWVKGPGMDLFEKVAEKLGSPNIIAEDLGTVDESLKEFLEAVGYPGMKVMQFGFTTEDSDHAPYKYLPNCVAYTGTHDNDTMLGWLWAIPMEEKLRLLSYCRYHGIKWGEGGPKSEVIREIISTLWQTAAGMVIIPVQDMCGFGTDTRLNIPGKAEGNWEFRITQEALDTIDKEFFVKTNKIYGRI